MSYTCGPIAIITIIIIIIIIIIMVVAAAVVGARMVQSLELGYEREGQRTAIRFRRPLPALANTEPPIGGY
jgi:flagellar basal body-associated protein FliL